MLPDLIDWPWSPAWGADGLPLHVERTRGSCQPHQHPFHELVLVIRGTGRHRDASGERELRPGDVLVLHPQAWHAYPDGADLQVCNCVFRSALLDRLPVSAAELGLAARLLRRRPPHPLAEPPLHLHAGEGGRRELARLLDTMIAERRECRDGWPAALLALFVQLAVAIGRLPAGEAPRPQPSDIRVDAAIRRLAEHFRDPPPALPALAVRAGLSPGHFSRRFAARAGLGVAAFVHQLRIEEACRLLRGGAASVTAVATAVGYDDPTYFTRQFTRLVGRPPRSYRVATISGAARSLGGDAGMGRGVGLRPASGPAGPAACREPR